MGVAMSVASFAAVIVDDPVTPDGPAAMKS